MKSTELTELAKAFVALSNAHRMDLVMGLFAAGARYSATSGNEHRGRAAIGDMLNKLRADYPDIYWQSDNFRCDDHRVSFDFTVRASATDDNPALERRGSEHIDYTADGAIKKIDVEIRTD